MLFRSKDLKSQFPDMKGLSPRNLGYMKAFAEAWPDDSILQQAAAKLPWFHNCIILDKIKAPEERLWYVQAAIEYGWSRNILVMQIDSSLHRRTNFRTTLQSRNLILPSSFSRTPTISISSPFPRMLTNESWRPAL